MFRSGTKDELLKVLPALSVDALPELPDERAYREWFTVALEPLVETIGHLNPPELNPRIHPGYRWGHATKVLALYVRDFVLFSRYFSEEDARRIEPLLFCPVDGIVMERLARAGADPGVRFIRELDEPTFWRIQDALRVAAAEVGVPRVWFDDVWSDRE